MLYRMTHLYYIIFKKDDSGYITDGDYWVFYDKSKTVFLKALSREPRELKEMLTEIAGVCKNVDPTVIEQDARDFYKKLEESGFIVSGENEEELKTKDKPIDIYNLKSRLKL